MVGLIVVIDMHDSFFVCMWNVVVMIGLRGVGVLTCMIDPELRDI